MGNVQPRSYRPEFKGYILYLKIPKIATTLYLVNIGRLAVLIGQTQRPGGLL